MEEFITIILLYVVGCTLFVVITCIKDGENILEGLCDFYMEWWEHIKVGGLFVLILAFVCYLIGQ